MVLTFPFEGKRVLVSCPIEGSVSHNAQDHSLGDFPIEDVVFFKAGDGVRLPDEGSYFTSDHWIGDFSLGVFGLQDEIVVDAGIESQTS